MQNRIPAEAVPFIVPASIKLKLNLTLTGPFAEQLRQWAEKNAAGWKEYPSYQRELRAEQRRLAFMLLCEAIGAVADGGGFSLKDHAVDAGIAPRLDVARGVPRRVELLEMSRVALGMVADYNRRLRN